MPTYDIIVKKTGTERHSVDASSPEEALKRYNDGGAWLKDDETDGVDSVTIVDRATGKKFDAEELEDADELKEYDVRIIVTVRAIAEDTILAKSWEDAVEKAGKLDPKDYVYSYERDQGIEGDEMAFLGESGEMQEHEIDLRQDGEPLSWEAVKIVKDLAKLDISDDQAIANLIGRAVTACSKGAPDAA